jgi:exonuclease III
VVFQLAYFVNSGPPKTELILMTQNCRGHNDPNKLRMLLRNRMKNVRGEKFVLALQETYLMNDKFIKWSENYAFTSSESPHSAGCITYLHDTAKILDIKHIDDRGHGHVIVIEGLIERLTIIANIYVPGRSLSREQETFYENMSNIIEEFELKYILQEPNLIILGDFNLPLETQTCANNVQRERARI